MAIASSKVSSLRVRISSGMWPKVKTLRWKAITMSEPMDSTTSLTLEFRPLTTDDMPMTVITPMTMPRTVRPERILFLRMVSRAMAKISP